MDQIIQPKCLITCFQSFFGFGQSADIDIVLDGTENRQRVGVKTEDGKKEGYLVYYDGESVSGKVSCILKMLDLNSNSTRCGTENEGVHVACRHTLKIFEYAIF